MRRTLLFVLLPVACRGTQLPRPAGPVSTPSAASPWLAPLTLAPDDRNWHVSMRGARDTADRPIGEKAVSQSWQSSEAVAVLIAVRWRAPLASVDSLLVAPDGLRPIREMLAFNGFTRRYQYAGDRVWGTVEHADSATRSVDRVFPEAVFAFNEVDLLVRSVPFHPGWTTVVPLFSEADEDVEHDTITVIGPGQSTRTPPGGRTWIVRFADPAIVSSYTVSADAREIVSIDTEQRRTHAVIRTRGR